MCVLPTKCRNIVAERWQTDAIPCNCVHYMLPNRAFAFHKNSLLKCFEGSIIWNLACIHTYNDIIATCKCICVYTPMASRKVWCIAIKAQHFIFGLNIDFTTCVLKIHDPVHMSVTVRVKQIQTESNKNVTVYSQWSICLLNNPLGH